MSIDDVPAAEIAALLAAGPEGFVAARTARAKELRANGRRDVVTALAKVRKPLRIVWLVGDLARHHPEVAAAAAAVAVELETAQAEGSGVRAQMKRFRDVVNQVASLTSGFDPSAEVVEVGLALREVLADPAARASWLAGTLLSLPGVDDQPAGTTSASATARSSRDANGEVPKSGADATGGSSDGAQVADELAARRARRKARPDGVSRGAAGDVDTANDTDSPAVDSARPAIEAARRAEMEARAAAEEAARKAEEAAAEARRAREAMLDELHLAVGSARDALTAAEADQEAARRSLDDLEDELEDLLGRVEAARDEVEAHDISVEQRRLVLEQARSQLAEIENA